MDAEIQRELDHIEKRDEVRILLAVESGSRAWGFASTDSDWDVRFVYIRPPERYLSIRRQRDVLEYPISAGLDVSGWDLPKALGLFAKSNPPLHEWLRSPIKYRESSSAAQRMRDLSSQFFSSRPCMHHYFHMAAGNFREYLKGDVVRVKKYFYVLRPILACRWIEAHGTMPPTEFGRLVEDRLPRELRPTLDALLERKRLGDELAAGPRIPEINYFLESELERARAVLSAIPRTPAPDWGLLDRVFRDTLDEVWAGGAKAASPR
ncbi:MAG: nucleotidyltransferase domain-containing protein [Vicinamibacteria bacterium]|nr:nucleotidyltransferase domain-containing protein [Vicinamibacteria bacterium]